MSTAWNALMEAAAAAATAGEWLEVDLADAKTRAYAAEARCAELTAENAALEARVAELTPLKPALRGLITTQPDYLDTIPYAEFGSMKLRWNSIEKSPGVYDFTALDATLAAHPDIKFRVRFMAGIHSPEWVKDRSGGAVYHQPDQANGGTGYVPRFWTEAYYSDYMALMAAVADRYEDNPQVVEIPNSLTTTVYAEPFILAADAATIDRYWQAGYRKDLVESNLRRSIAAMMDMFPTTRISLAGHGKWQFIVQGPNGPGDGKYAASWEDERALLNELSALYSKRLVIEDHGLGPEDAYYPTGEPRETATSLYAYMSGLRDTEQTHGWQFTPNGGSIEVAAEHGVAMKACFLEFAHFPIAEPKRRQIHDTLLANAAGKP
jgi:hypothetical protein